jgi:tetratricopeptide (TPR) repeat protein
VPPTRPFLDFTGRWDDLLWLHEQAEARALTAGDKENAGWRAYEAGWVYYLRGQADQVLACAARAAEHWQESAPRNKATAIRLRGLGNRLKKDYPAAIAAYREALDIYRALSPESNDVASALNDLAGVERANKDYAAAERDYREALRIAKKTKTMKASPTTQATWRRSPWTASSGPKPSPSPAKPWRWRKRSGGRS